MFGAFYLNAQTTSPSPYCDAEFDDAIQFGIPFNVPDAIFAVSFGTLNNNTGSQAASLITRSTTIYLFLILR